MAEDGVINGSLKVTLVAAKGLKPVGSAAPSSLVRLRILNTCSTTGSVTVSQGQSSEVTPAVRKTTDPVFNQDFKFRIKDVENARLDVTLWDSDVSMTEEAGFLGEVMLNVGKLINYAGTGIQQTFTVRTAPGKDGNKEQNGQFAMKLLYNHDCDRSGQSLKPAMAWTPVQQCGLVALLCSIWNLFGDLCYIDFYLAHMTFEGFGTIDSVSRPGNLFSSHQNGPLQLAQAGGWIYPVWAFATTYPLYLGLCGAGWRCSSAPCALLAYGLCVVGGALHSGFLFSTILPQVLHHPQRLQGTMLKTRWKPMAGGSTCAAYMHAAQVLVMESYTFGYTPGPPAVMVASFWIAYVVATRKTRFPRWFIFFTPPVTAAWVTAVGFLLIPDPWGKYVVGALGTWIILVMNIATSCTLWNVKERKMYPFVDK